MIRFNHLPSEEGMYYAVVWIKGGLVIYRGQSLATTAEYLEPGTFFGKSLESVEAAIAEAQVARELAIVRSWHCQRESGVETSGAPACK